MDGQYGIHQRSGKTEPVAGLTLEVPLVEECSETVVAQIAVEVHLREFIEGSLAVAYVSAIVEEFSALLQRKGHRVEVDGRRAEVHRSDIAPYHGVACDGSVDGIETQPLRMQELREKSAAGGIDIECERGQCLPQFIDSQILPFYLTKHRV